jgi:hypothetical protein
MTRKVETTTCPRNPEHGMVRKRWLPHEDREYIKAPMFKEVFEIDCPHCGKTEHLEDLETSPSTR